jgi:hypothetical protein
MLQLYLRSSKEGPFNKKSRALYRIVSGCLLAVENKCRMVY